MNCPSCGANTVKPVVVVKDGKVVERYYECRHCGNVWPQ